MINQPTIDLAEVPTTHKRLGRSSGREGRGVIGRPHAVLWCMNHGRQLLGIGTPKHERDGPGLIVNGLQHRAAQRLPAPAPVACRRVSFYREHAIEQQYPLSGPRLELAIQDAGLPTITSHFLKDVAQRRRALLCRSHRKSQAIRLPWLVVRVLADDDDSDGVEWRQIQGSQRAWGINLCPLRERLSELGFQGCACMGLPKVVDKLTPTVAGQWCAQGADR